MDYLIGFLVGYCCKEIYNLIKYMATADTFLIAHDYDEDWDILSHDDLP
tara:strand:+ start:2341 stop:2487 length:147 start_codon:yes stop_codon:yes gene_type:complete